MVAKYLNDRLQALDFALKLFYLDDLILIGSLKTLNKALGIINQLENTTGIKLNFEKTVIYCQLSLITTPLQGALWFFVLFEPGFCVICVV